MHRYYVKAGLSYYLCFFHYCAGSKFIATIYIWRYILGTQYFVDLHITSGKLIFPALIKEGKRDNLS